MQAVDEVLCQKLRHLIAKTELSVSDEQVNLLVAFVEMIQKWNQAYNLTSIRNVDDMLVKHIMDSIIVAPLLINKDNDKNTFIDVGTGPGLPGIPLAIMHPDKEFILLDSLGKRVRFMQQVIYNLKIKNAKPVQSRVEEYTDGIPFSGVISRAFASTQDMLHWCHHLLDETGKFFALKGQYPSAELDQLKTDYTVVEAHTLQVPHLIGERHLIVISKNNNAKETK
ncbi:16S rRNA (guanine(527)-N(7))-methyltransferase RsmG [Opacimonas viscosa]|uniref:Ribosomal RNA small subunit methyltransferase G n=1 Tax=Opacimonas viscosa TaxID=2961944 RepID=A0AA41X2B6_9ALTE|nr:16S rRNA (guanine(527)-N(7))-methyltransferase RsmG [Opacimonas viscosa]MCP3428718.1 16S rRNA (guanine(527)-N(7))-methyltransferase RsmG [Opacimonas viscosa]